MGQRVLLIDEDPQGNSTSGVGITKKNIKKSVYDALVDDASPEDCIIKTEFENLSIVPSTISLAGAEFELMERAKKHTSLAEALSSLGDRFQFIFIDCPPSLGLLTVNALTASNGVIIPMQCEYYALEGLSQLMMTVRRVKNAHNPDLTIAGILITMYDGRLNLSAQVLTELKKYYADKLFRTMIPRNVKLSEAPSFGAPVYYHDKYSRGSLAYIDVAKELLDRIF
jgi:chromosome partitioning protein